MSQLNFNHFYYFYIVTKEGSIKAASERLHVSQPTISDQIKLLEDYFSCRLFDRVNRSLVLTKEGKLALEYAEKVFELSSDLTFRLRNKIELPKRSIDIGITHQMSHYFLYDVIMPLFNQADLLVNFVQGDRHHLIADLSEGNIDILFSVTNDSILSSMNSYRIGVNKTFVVAHKKYKNQQNSFPECLNSIPFFSYTKESFLKYEIDHFFSKNSLTPKIVGAGDDMDLFQVVLENGLAFTIVPEVSKNRLCQNKNIVVLGEIEELQTSVYGIVKNNYRGLGYQLLKGQI